MARATAKPVPRIDRAPTTDASQTISRSSLRVVEVHIASAPSCLLKAGTKRQCDSRRRSPAPPIGVTPQLCRWISPRGLRGVRRRDRHALRPAQGRSALLGLTFRRPCAWRGRAGRVSAVVTACPSVCRCALRGPPPCARLASVTGRPVHHRAATATVGACGCNRWAPCQLLV
jgi:hypothetical protein